MKIFSIFKKIAKAGDIVICIDDRNYSNANFFPPPVKFKQKYKVLDVQKVCHGYIYNVGLVLDGYTTCSKCDGVFPGLGIHWAASERFRLATPEEKEEYFNEQNEIFKTENEHLFDKRTVEEKIKEFEKEERYEEAQKLLESIK